MIRVFRDVAIADGVSENRGHIDVVIEDGVVSAIRATGPAWHGDRVVGQGGWLAPGLVDGHVHFKADDDGANEVLALHYLTHGITSVMCMDGSQAVLKLRDQVARRQIPGPQLWTTGPIQDDPRLTYADGRRSAAEQAACGYDAIKVYNDLSADGFHGLLDGARHAGLPVVGHVVRAAGLERTLASGQAHIAHLEEFIYTKLGITLDRLMDARPVRLDADAIDELSAALIERRQSVGTTIEALAAALQQVRDAATWCGRPDIARLPWSVKGPWLPPGNFYANRFSEATHVRAFKRLVRLAGGIASILSAAHVQLVAASDALNCGAAPGSSLWRELGHLVRAGLSDAEALRAAMPLPLSAGGADRQIEVGACADLILLDGDPFQSIQQLSSLRGVVSKGVWRTAGEIWAEIRSATKRLDTEENDVARTPRFAREAHRGGSGAGTSADSGQPSLPDGTG